MTSYGSQGEWTKGLLQPDTTVNVNIVPEVSKAKHETGKSGFLSVRSSRKKPLEFLARKQYCFAFCCVRTVITQAFFFFFWRTFDQNRASKEGFWCLFYLGDYGVLSAIFVHCCVLVGLSQSVHSGPIFIAYLSLFLLSLLIANLLCSGWCTVVGACVGAGAGGGAADAFPPPPPPATGGGISSWSMGFPAFACRSRSCIVCDNKD